MFVRRRARQPMELSYTYGAAPPYEAAEDEESAAPSFEAPYEAAEDEESAAPSFEESRRGGLDRLRAATVIIVTWRRFTAARTSSGCTTSSTQRALRRYGTPCGECRVSL